MALRDISLNIRIIFIVIIFFSISQFIKSDTEVNHHLLNYTDLIPLKYDVNIELDFRRNVLHGECNIIINITRPMMNISIPSVNFGILKLDLTNNDGNKIIHVPRYSFIDETYIYIDFTNSSVNILLPGTYILHMIYLYNIYDETFLVYKEDLGEKVLTVTGVEVIRAQQIFPCWDEPAFESTFIISIMHHKNFTALSNMLINTEEYIDESNMMWTHFDKSPIMSIKRLTIVITTFTNIVLQFQSRFIYATIWCRENMIRSLDFSQLIIEEVFHFLNKKSQMIIPKIDYVAISRAQHGNIETWGLILHREEDITYNEALDSIARKIEVANLLARQVISFWCDYLSWPIEGFTTYFAAHILGKIPSISYIHDLFIVQVLQESLRFDIPSYNYNSILHSNNLDVQINKTFLNYIKPPVLWYILQHILEEDIWSSIRAYTKYNQSSSTKTDDFWHIIQTSDLSLPYFSILSVKEYIDISIKKNYYPVLHVTLNATDDTISFSYLSSQYINEDMEQLPALVTYTIIQREANNTLDVSVLLSPQHTILTNIKNVFKVVDENYCVIVNVKQTGYYRVNYNYEGWRKLVQCLRKNYTVHVLNQAQVIDDAFHFLIHRRLSLNRFWNIVSFLSQNTNYVAWYPMIKAFEYMACAYSFHNATGITDNMRNILNRVLEIIGYDEKPNESDLTKCLREETAKWACIINAAKCRENATLHLIKYLKNPVEDNRFTWKEWKYCKGLMLANYTIWNHIREKRTTFDNRILDYLTCCKNSSIIILYLKQSLGLTKKYKYFIQERDKRVNIIVLTVAKHVRDLIVFEFILKCLRDRQIVLSKYWEVDRIAILIISITHVHSAHQLQEVNIFATTYLKEKKLIDAVKDKISKHKLKRERQIANFGSLSQHDDD
ncbi:aminopeptidase N-like isoform X3 [Linepithema humile]|uniref:aminopeptidase N-like isoform X3 n=1 Tax=Linepithema humile TaxID=83485 RepID=UPI0006237CBB|nr:PREDICTED: glutamyl aminopeptidase-like [Linepithema humile]